MEDERNTHYPRAQVGRHTDASIKYAMICIFILAFYSIIGFVKLVTACIIVSLYWNGRCLLAVARVTRSHALIKYAMICIFILKVFNIYWGSKETPFFN